MRGFFGNLIRWISVDRPGVLLQVRHFGEGIVARVENLEPQGVHFAPPAGAQGLAVAPGGVSSEMVTIDVSGTKPGDTLNAGEGGLHLLGTFKVFLADDGTVHLGAANPGDFIALASKVDSELTKIKADLDALKTSYDAHTHAAGLLIWPGGTVSAPVTGTTGAPVAGAPTPHSPASVASVKVKAL